MNDYGCLRGIEISGRRMVVFDVHWWLDAEKFARIGGAGDAVTQEAVAIAVRDAVAGKNDAGAEELTRLIMQALFDAFVAIRMVKVSVHDGDAQIIE